MRTAKEELREIRNRLVYLYGKIDGTFDPPALKEVCEIADEGLADKDASVCNAAAIRSCDAILLLENWDTSKGAKTELLHALSLGKIVYDFRHAI